ncbi:MAG: hypothetical protein MUO22_06565, partial [Sedimentisphaerales bacterium]|nr:hypothetical protein [Sedimentisphaerales bacterium]
LPVINMVMLLFVSFGCEAGEDCPPSCWAVSAIVAALHENNAKQPPSTHKHPTANAKIQLSNRIICQDSYFSA